MKIADPISASGSKRVEQPIRLAEVVGALSIATDLGTGQPLELASFAVLDAHAAGEIEPVAIRRIGHRT